MKVVKIIDNYAQMVFKLDQKINIVGYKQSDDFLIKHYRFMYQMADTYFNKFFVAFVD